ncbi:MAG TPA: sugar nucleotide-binding protein [Candidatus Gemmiger avium]|nr:sugar nucleotide-binding protein [Candidatus Gemmiger avium]
MPDTVLVGSTGFVGGNLLAAHPFDAAYHSTDVQNGFGRDNGLVVYAGVPAAMYLANADPAADLAVMAAARENLRRLAPKKVVLISSICVFADSRGKTEADEPTPEGLAPYGANRLQLERWVREDWPDALIVRLPALYGKGLKKNFLYDLHTITPALLRPDKYRQLAAESELVRIAYEDAGNGFYKLNGKVDPAALRAWFAAAPFNALAFTDSRSVYQFYDLARLWRDIRTALDADLRVLHLATPPLSAARVYEAFTGKTFTNHLPGAPFDYDLRTRHAALLGGAGEYLCTEPECLTAVCDFLKNWN